MSEQPVAPRRSRISDVAAAAGVSPTTVSHALSGARAVNEATRARILAVARELDYTPDRVASGLRRQRTGLVGFIGDHIATTPFAGRMISGARTAGLERDRLLVVAETEGNEAEERMFIGRFLAQRMDGLLIGRMFNQRVSDPSLPAGVPVVLVNAAPEHGWHVDAVVPDEAQIAVEACARLLREGHREFAYVGTVDESRAARGRLIGVRMALGDAGVSLPNDRIERAPSDAPGGRAAGLRLLAGPRRPTAVVCFNDQIAMGVMQAAARLGIRVPDELSLVGIDDLHTVADALDPGLTSVALPHAEMGRRAMEILLDRIDRESADVPPAVHQIPGWLVERGTVAPPPT